MASLHMRHRRWYDAGLRQALSVSGALLSAACLFGCGHKDGTAGSPFLIVGLAEDQLVQPELGRLAFVQATPGLRLSIVSYGGEHRLPSTSDWQGSSCVATLGDGSPLYLYERADRQFAESSLYVALLDPDPRNLDGAPDIHAAVPFPAPCTGRILMTRTLRVPVNALTTPTENDASPPTPPVKDAGPSDGGRRQDAAPEPKDAAPAATDAAPSPKDAAPDVSRIADSGRTDGAVSGDGGAP